MSAGLENTTVAPVFMSHGRLTDTNIPCTPYDPRLGGYDTSNPRILQPPTPVPSFQGQLVAWYVKVGVNRYAYLLVGHDANDGQGLRWIEVASNKVGNVNYRDTRTGLSYDEWYLSNCNPPWVCE